MLNVKITIDDGKGKKAEIEISEAGKLEKLLIIKNVFELFGVDSDIVEMVDEYNRIGKMYSSFFNNIEQIENPKSDEVDKNETKEQLKELFEQAYEENKEEIQTTYTKVDDHLPYFVRTGVKIKADGRETYKLRYECYACYFKSTFYVFSNTIKINCRKCGHELAVESASNLGFPNRDTFGNFFKAGDYQDMNLPWA